jgi:Flp pilus assembly pilin Flp
MRSMTGIEYGLWAALVFVGVVAMLQLTNVI